jgi:hypothetical protein
MNVLSDRLLREMWDEDEFSCSYVSFNSALVSTIIVEAGTAVAFGVFIFRILLMISIQKKTL